MHKKFASLFVVIACSVNTFGNLARSESPNVFTKEDAKALFPMINQGNYVEEHLSTAWEKSEEPKREGLAGAWNLLLQDGRNFGPRLLISSPTPGGEQVLIIYPVQKSKPPMRVHMDEQPGLFGNYNFRLVEYRGATHLMISDGSHLAIYERPQITQNYIPYTPTQEQSSTGRALQGKLQ